MAGAHRNPENQGLRGAGSLLLLPAVIGLAVYLIVAGSSLETWSVLWVVWAGLTGQALWTGRARWRVAALRAAIPFGLVLSATWQVVDAVARRRDWAAGSLHALAVAGTWERRIVAVAGGIALVCLITRDVTGRRRRRAAAS